jgi:hypothetical protein
MSGSPLQIYQAAAERLYGPWLGGQYGVTPDSDGQEVYHYHTQVARGDTAILAGNGSNDSKISV